MKKMLEVIAKMKIKLKSLKNTYYLSLHDML
jgi:hypothetical protein